MKMKTMTRITSTRTMKKKIGHPVPNLALAPALNHLPDPNLHLALNLSAGLHRIAPAVAPLCFLCATLLASSLPAADIKIENALVKLIDQLDLPAREAGTLVQLDVQEGAKVPAGAPLVRIDDTEARFAEERAKVELQISSKKAASDVAIRAAERASQAAALELKRAEDARQRLRDVVTENEIEKLRLAADQAKLAIEKAQQEQAVAELERNLKKVECDFAAANVARRQSAAPFPGVIVQVYKHVGDWAQPGDKLLRVVRLDRLRVEGFLDAAQTVPGLEGRPVTLLVDLPGRPGATFSGKLIFVSPEIDPFNKSARILAEIENPHLQLQPGLRGTIVIKSPSGRN